MLPLRRLRPLQGRFRKTANEVTPAFASFQQPSLPYGHSTTRSSSRGCSTRVFCRHETLPRKHQFGDIHGNHQQHQYHVTSTLLSTSTEEKECPTNKVTIDGTEVASPSSSSSAQRDEIVELLETNTKGATDKAVRLLSEMMRQYDATNIPSVAERPDNSLYEAVLESLVRHGATGDRKATALQAQTIMTEMKKLYQSSGDAKDPELRPSTICHAHLITAWSRASSPEATIRAFWDMLEPKNLAPSASSTSPIPSKVLRAHLGQSLNRVLKTIATSGVPDAGKRCDRLFAKVGNMAFPSGITLSPNPESFHFLVQAWQATVENTTAGETLMKTPKDMVNAARRIEDLLKFMIHRYEANDKQNSEWLPKPEMYLWLMKAYGYAGAPDKAQQLLQRLIQEQDRVFKAGGVDIEADTPLRMPPPTTTMYNCVLESWGRQGKPGEAARLLSQWVSRCSHAGISDAQRKEVCRPDLDSCHLVIHAWGQFADYQNAPKAETILHRMKEAVDSKDDSGWPTPTVETYNAVLEAWSRHRDNHKIAKAVTNIDRVMEEMVQLIQGPEGGSIKYHPCSPNSRTYELVFETYARFGFKLFHRRKKTAKLLRQMKHFSITPTERSLVLMEICQEDGKSLDDVEAEEQGSI